MKARSLLALLVLLTVSALVIGGCGTTTTTTVTQFAPSPTTTVTVPGSVTTVPATTVVLPGGTTTIPATTITVPPLTIPPSPPQATGEFLPSNPPALSSHMADVVTVLIGQCLQCHGPTLYLQFPMAPSWDGSDHGSQINIGVYSVIAGSIQDHTGRTADVCLTCHAVPPAA